MPNLQEQIKDYQRNRNQLVLSSDLARIVEQKHNNLFKEIIKRLDLLDQVERLYDIKELYRDGELKAISLIEKPP